ncbi:MAG: extracellular solute-binding protein [Prochloraceae cyanobacterium]
MDKFLCPTRSNLTKTIALPLLSTLLLLGACDSQSPTNNSQLQGLEVKFLAGSNLGKFCQEIAKKLNTKPIKLSNGQSIDLTCEAKGSGDVIATILSLAQQHKAGTIPASSPQFPTLLSVDGEIYQSRLIYQMNKIFPGQNYIPEITDSPLIAYSPMVFMTSADLAKSLEKLDDPYTALVKFNNYRQIDPNAPSIPIRYVHTAPTRSNSGLQTLVAQFASVSGKLPEQLSVTDVRNYQDQVREIESKITRYGISTSSLANSMVKNGPYWASVASVYESAVIRANSNLQPGQTRYQAIYPQATFSSNIRAILPQAPWVSKLEKEAAEKVIEFMRQPENQQIAVKLGLRPGTPGVSLGVQFSPQFGVQSSPTYESYRSPQPEVVDAMLKSWQQFAKKPSLVAVVVDTSGSMQGQKLAAVQNTLLNYVNNLGPREKLALIRFSSTIDRPVLVDGSKQGRQRGIEFINKLQASGGTRLYDSALYASNWLQKNFRSDAINAVVILTDGEDYGSKINLEKLEQELKKTSPSSDRRIAFFTIGYGQKGEFSPEVLQKIAEFNGGYYSQGNPETISDLMAKLQLEF